MKATVRLPATAVARLTTLRGPDLHAQVHALTTLGWSLTALGEALNAGPTTVQCWADRGAATGLAAAPWPRPPHAATTASVNSRYVAGVVASRAPQLAPATAEYLRELTARATRVRAGTSERAASWRARDELNTALAAARARGIPVQELARATQRTSRAVRDRLDATPAAPVSAPLVSSAHSFTDPRTPAVAVWPGTGRSTRWSTFVHRARPDQALCVSNWLYRLPATAVLLTEDEAHDQLGWTCFYSLVTEAYS